LFIRAFVWRHLQFGNQYLLLAQKEHVREAFSVTLYRCDPPAPAAFGHAWAKVRRSPAIQVSEVDHLVGEGGFGLFF
jgi:hypothetical protein